MTIRSVAAIALFVSLIAAATGVDAPAGCIAHAYEQGLGIDADVDITGDGLDDFQSGTLQESFQLPDREGPCV